MKNENEPEKVVASIRYSSHNQDDGNSVSAQMMCIEKYCAELRCFYDKKVPKIKAVGELCNTKGENADKFFIFCKCGYHSFDYQDFLKYNEYNDKLIGK